MENVKGIKVGAEGGEEGAVAGFVQLENLFAVL